MAASRESIKWLFARLTATYATQWLAKWEGINMDMVESVWADELDGFTVRQVKHALTILPRDFPPNAMQFRDLCKTCPEAPFVALPAPKPDPARLAAAIAKMASRSDDEYAAYPKHVRGAMILRDRDMRGEHVTLFQRDQYQCVLRIGKYAPSAESETTSE